MVIVRAVISCLLQTLQMISKSVTSPDVHELIVSAKEFERRERNQEDVYKGTIKNRKVTDPHKKQLF